MFNNCEIPWRHLGFVKEKYIFFKYRESVQMIVEDAQ